MPSLHWLPNTEPDIAGYSVLMRSTISPLWEKETWVGNVTSYAMADVSIDDVVIGVKAVDRGREPEPHFALYGTGAAFDAHALAGTLGAFPAAHRRVDTRDLRDARAAQRGVIFLETFFDEVRHKVPTGK